MRIIYKHIEVCLCVHTNIYTICKSTYFASYALYRGDVNNKAFKETNLDKGVRNMAII